MDEEIARRQDPFDQLKRIKDVTARLVQNGTWKLKGLFAYKKRASILMTAVIVLFSSAVASSSHSIIGKTLF